MLTKSYSRQTLLERVMSNPKIDRNAGILRGVKILGAESKNGRTYTLNAMRNAVGMYENAAVFIDHPDKKTPNAGRSVRDLVGHLENVRFNEANGGALFGDLHLVRSNPLSEMVMDLADSKKIGLSHNASGYTEQRDGRMVVEEIDSVRSVDIVVSPATTNSLFESVDSNMNRNPARRRELLETIALLIRDPDLRPTTKTKVVRRRLTEMDGMDALPVGSSISADDTAVENPALAATVVAKIKKILVDTSLTDDGRLKAIAVLFASSGDDDTDVDPESIPVDAADMAECINTGRTRAQSASIMEGASRMAVAYGGKPIAGTRHAQELKEGAERLMKLCR